MPLPDTRYEVAGQRARNCRPSATSKTWRPLAPLKGQ